MNNSTELIGLTAADRVLTDPNIDIKARSTTLFIRLYIDETRQRIEFVLGNQLTVITYTKVTPSTAVLPDEIETHHAVSKIVNQGKDEQFAKTAKVVSLEMEFNRMSEFLPEWSKISAIKCVKYFLNIVNLLTFEAFVLPELSEDDMQAICNVFRRAAKEIECKRNEYISLLEENSDPSLRELIQTQDEIIAALNAIANSKMRELQSHSRFIDKFAQK